MTRPQVFADIGGRAETRQTVALGATRTDRLTSIMHRGVNETSMDGVWVGPLGSVTSVMYATPNFSSRQNVVRVNTVMPGALRAPGENPSAFGIECAIDELAYEVGIDPLAIRLKNYAEQDPHEKAVVDTAAARSLRLWRGTFGWSRANQRRGRCATATADRMGRGGRHLSVRRTPGEALVRVLAAARSRS